MARPTLIDLILDKYNQGLRYYLFMVNVDRCNGSFNLLDGLSCKLQVPNKTEDVSVSVFNITTRKNESKALTRQISRKCKFSGRKCNSNQN